MKQESLAERLRILRARRGISVKQASEQIGVEWHTLRDLELGRRKPYYPTLNKIAEGYGVPVEELLDLEKEPVLSGKAEAPKEAGPSAEASPERRQYLMTPKRKEKTQPAEEGSESPRTIHLELLAAHASQVADMMKEEIAAGHVTPEWGTMFCREMTSVMVLFDEMQKVFPGSVPEEGIIISGGEKRGLERVSQTVEKVQEIIDKLDEALGPDITEKWHKDLRDSIRLVRSESQVSDEDRQERKEQHRAAGGGA